MSEFMIKQDGIAGNGDYGYETKKVWCTEAVTAGDWVAYHLGDATNPAGLEGFSYRKGDSSNPEAVYNTVGVALETTTAAGYVTIVIGGYCASALVDGATTKGATLIISTTAGQAEAGTTAGYRQVGLALADDTAGYAPVVVFKHPMFL